MPHPFKPRALALRHHRQASRHASEQKQWLRSATIIGAPQCWQRIALSVGVVLGFKTTRRVTTAARFSDTQ